MDLVKIGHYIAGKRKALGLTQRQLAEQLGMSDKSVSKWERGVCLPDVSIYEPLCSALGIRINEFLAGEDIAQENLILRAEENLVSVSEYGAKRRKRLIVTVVLLLICAAALAAALSVQALRAARPRNVILPLPKDSAEQQTAELLAGADGAYLFRYETGAAYERLNIFVSEYRNGELANRQHLICSYESVGSPKEGMIVIVPDFEHFVVKLITADESTKLSTKIPILEDAERREYYGRSETDLKKEIPIHFNKEQAILALVYDPDFMRVLDLTELERGRFPSENEFLYLFSICFS